MNKKLALMARAEEQVYDKIRDDTFHAIVNRAFMGALPMDRSDLNKESIREISKFSKAALEAAGGYSLLENAIENVTNPSQKAFLEDMKKSREAGMDEHLSKPVDIAALEQTVKRFRVTPRK